MHECLLFHDPLALWSCNVERENNGVLCKGSQVVIIKRIDFLENWICPYTTKFMAEESMPYVQIHNWPVKTMVGMVWTFPKLQICNSSTFCDIQHKTSTRTNLGKKTENNLTGGNWQKWKRVFLTCPCHKIYRDEAVGLKNCKNTWKITIFVKMWNLGQNRENLIFCQ